MRKALLIAGVALGCVLGGSAASGLRWNLSPSLEPGLYRQSFGAPERGDVVLVCLPEAIGRWARGRGYLGRGDCPGASAPLGKRIAAVAGDHVEVEKPGVAVNGQWLEGTRRVGHDSLGRRVPLVPEGEAVLGPDEVWLHSGRRPRSFDSRVFGPLEVARIRAVLEPLLILEQD